tara:strand:+ start:917 stop:1138 length:222 start_codon:yes stop_codon:yes gene_type:complete
MKADKMNKYTIEEIDKIRDFYNKIINESEHGNYKNVCTYENCNNRTVYKHQELKDYKYYCNKCVDIKKTEVPM